MLKKSPLDSRSYDLTTYGSAAKETAMRQLIVVLAITALAGCGVETATTAATGAAIKKQEMEEGKKTMERAQQKIDALGSRISLV